MYCFFIELLNAEYSSPFMSLKILKINCALPNIFLVACLKPAAGTQQHPTPVRWYLAIILKQLPGQLA